MMSSLRRFVFAGSLQAILMLALLTPAIRAHAQLPGFGSPTPCPPNMSCVPGTPPAAPGTCGPAAGGATCGGAGPASIGGAFGANVGAGNPINVITGNKYQREVDMPALPGVLGLEIVRHYNSAYSRPNHSTNLMGRGWKLSYETELHASATALQIVQADGARIIFSRDPRNPSLCHSANAADGTLEVIKTRRGEEYRWRWTDGRQLSFDSAGKLVQILAPSGEFVSLQYDRRGLLVKVTDPQGRSLRLHYPEAKSAHAGYRGVQVIDSPVGRYTYSYGGGKGAGAATLASLARVGYPASAGAAGVGRRYHYEDARHPTLLTGISIESANGGATPAVARYATYGYDADGRAVLSTHAGNVGAIKVDYSAAGLTRVTNSLGGVTVFRHALVGGQHRLLEVRGDGCKGCAEPNTRYGYDDLGRPLEVTRLDGAGKPVETTRTTLDRYGRPLQVRRIDYVNGAAQAPRTVARYEYADGPALRPTLIAKASVVEGKEHVTRIRYNGFGQRVSVRESGWTPGLRSGEAVAAIERSTTYSYRSINGRSLLAQVDGPLANGKSASPLDSDITRIEYDAGGNHIMKVVAPGGQTTTVAALDAIGRPARIVTPDGVETRVDYDREGRPVQLVKAGVAQRYTYAPLGGMAGMVSATGERVSFEYAASGQLVAIADSQNNRIQLQWDTEDELLARTLLNPDGSVAQESDLNRFVPATSRETLPAQANARMTIAAVGLAAQGLNGAAVWAGAARASDGPDEASLSFDSASRLSQVQDARRQRTGYRYDDFGRLVSVNSPDSGLTLYAWDPADRLREKIIGAGAPDASRISYRYDPAGRVVEQRTRDGVTSIAYGPQGRPVSVAYPGGQELFAYDAAARLTSHVRVIDGRRFTTGYRYNALGQLVARTLPDGQVLTYQYNGPLHAKPGLLASIGRQDLFGKTVLLDGLNEAGDGFADQRYQLANGVDYVRRLDRFGGIRQIGSAGVWEESQQRGPDGLLGRRVASGSGKPHVTNLLYDPLGRLRGVDDAGAAGRGYTYDPAGNLLSQVTGKDRTTYQVAPDSNRLVAAVRGEAVRYYRYNSAGSVTQLGDTVYHWDSQQRLAKVERGGQPVAEYRYNAFGERIKKISYAGNQKKVVYYFYDGAQLVAEAEPDEGALEITRQYVWLEEYGHAKPIAMLARGGGGASGMAGAALAVIPTELTRSAGRAQQTEVFSIVADHTGAPRAMVDQGGQTVWRASVNGFGELTVSARSTAALNLRGSSQYFDAETGLHYNRHRYLDVASGRYLSADPSGQRGGINLYAFAENNPVDNVDPLGLQSKPAGAVTTWSMEDRLKYVMEKTAEKFPGEIGDALRDLVSLPNLATTAAVFAIWAGSHATPFGWVADIAMAATGVIFVGKAIMDVIDGVWDSSALIMNAKCEADLDKAAAILAKGLSAATLELGMGAAGGAAGGPRTVKLLTTIFKNKTVAKAKAAAAQAAISLSYFGKFVPGRVRSGAVANSEHIGRRGATAYPPWASTLVRDVWVNPGTKIYMVMGKSQVNPGGWATPKQFTSLSQARKELSLLEEFKQSGPDCCVLQEFTVTAPIPARYGVAGPLTSKVPPYDGYPGGAYQWELMIDRSLNWQDYLTKTGTPVVLK